MNLSKKKLRHWATESNALGYELGLDSNILKKYHPDALPRNFVYGFDNNLPFQLAFGRVDSLNHHMYLYAKEQNFSTFDDETQKKWLALHFSQEEVAQILKEISKIPKDIFFEIYNQTGMDHEYLGHIYHIAKNNDHTEETAVKMQIHAAKKRSELKNSYAQYYKIFVPLLERFLAKFKNIR